jgi:hypothetical protein
MMARGFVDLLFILLCGAIVMLSDSIRVKGLPVDPARSSSMEDGSAGSNPEILVVSADWVGIDGNRYESVGNAIDDSGSDSFVIVPSDRIVAHHRMVAIWDELDAAGCTASFGVLVDSEGVDGGGS